MRRDPSPVIHALRVSGDELQLARVLAALCSTSADIARAFLRAVLEVAAEDPSIGDRAGVVRLPPSIKCLPEQLLTRRGRGRTHEQSRMLGRVDLFFAAKGFRLICELKIDSGYQPDQIRRYLASGDYVVSVVRAPGKASLTKDIQGSERWLGEVAWSQIDRGLQSLPLGRRDKQQWLDLLAALHADGDFDAEKARGASEDDVRLARAAAEGALERLRRMRRFDSAHRGLLRDLRIGSSFEGRSRGWVPIVDTSGETYWFIGARNARSRRPEIVIDWLPWSEREPRGQRTMHRRLVQEHDFVRMGKPSAPYYRLRELLARDPGADDPAQAVESATAAIAAVIEIGLLRYDARAYDAA